jgi:hypothetical protein
MKTLNKTIALLLICILKGCASTQIFSDKDDAIDFNKYKTFAWLPTGNFSYGNGFDNQIIESNIKTNASKLLELAWLKADTIAPDLLFEYHIEFKNKTIIEQQPIYNYNYNNGMYNYGRYNYNRYYGYNPYWRHSNMNAPYIIGYKSVPVTYEEGTLLISAIDRNTNKLVWRGWSVSTVTDAATYELELKKDVTKILQKFPIQIPTK